MNEKYTTLSENIYHLSDESNRSIKQCYLEAKVNNLFEDSNNFETFINKSYGLIRHLPENILKSLIDFRVFGNRDGALLIRGFSIDESTLGPTPTNAKSQSAKKSKFDTEFYLLGCASLLGEVFAFKSQYGGQIIQNVIPIKEHAEEQKGTSSNVFLDWHTEDASFAERADIIALLCLRSNQDAATTIASISNMILTEEVKNILFQPRFWVETDAVHDEIEQKEILTKVLFGSLNDPYINLDPLYMRGADKEAQLALETIIGEIPRAARQIVLQQGDIVFIDNYRTVHGRTKFKPKYDGTDRWLQRVSISFDLRKSRHLRSKDFRLIDYAA